MFQLLKSFLAMISLLLIVLHWPPYVDRLYVYDNSIDDEDAQLLFRLSEGKLVKPYIEELPNWATLILS